MNRVQEWALRTLNRFASWLKAKTCDHVWTVLGEAPGRPGLWLTPAGYELRSQCCLCQLLAFKTYSPDEVTNLAGRRLNIVHGRKGGVSVSSEVVQ